MEKIRSFVSSRVFLYLVLFLFALFLASSSNDYDYDLYARLIVGEHFFKTGWISYQDFVSYTPTHIWYDHEWGSSIIFYAFLKLFGNFGLILLQTLTLFFTTFFIIKTQQIQKHAYPISIAFILGFMYLFSHQNPSIVRCHMFSFMFFAMLLYFLEKTRLYNSNLLWLMLPLTIIWNNMHGGVVSGLGMIFIYMICAILSHKPWRKYFWVLTLSTPLLAINPYGTEYLNFLYSANTKNRKFITEWWGVFVQWHVMYYYPIFTTIIFSIMLYVYKIFNKKKFCLTKIVALIVTATLGIMHVKLLSLPIIVIASLFYNDIISIFKRNSIKLLNKIAYAVICISILLIPTKHPAVAKTNLSKYPITEIEFIKQNDIKGNLLTAFGLGSYTSYKLYPNNLIYMDGRYEEVYYDREFDNLRYFNQVDEHNWEKVFTEYPTEILMPEKKSSVYDVLKSGDEWEEVYTGIICGVFLRKNRDKYFPPFKIPSSDLKYYQEREFNDLNVFKK